MGVTIGFFTKYVGDGVFSRQMKEGDAPPLVAQMLLILDEAFVRAERDKEGAKPPYETWPKSWQRELHHVALETIRTAEAEAHGRGYGLDKRMPDRELGQILASMSVRLAAQNVYARHDPGIPIALTDRYGLDNSLLAGINDEVGDDDGGDDDGDSDDSWEAAWYDDPDDPDNMWRWWDGSRWTDERHPKG